MRCSWVSAWMSRFRPYRSRTKDAVWNCGLTASIPVSYTHLDVYNRQGLDCSGYTEWVYQTALGVTLYDGTWNQWDALSLIHI